MFIYKNILVSDEILEARFGCDLGECRGECCCGGDAGAPMTNAEAAEFLNNESELEKYPAQYRKKFEKYGAICEMYNERLDASTYCTTTDGKGNCVFSYAKGGVHYCYIQKAGGFFKKPASCSLFPIREKRSGDTIMLNLHIYGECQNCFGPSKPPLIEFLRDVLIEQYGAGFYDALSYEARGRGLL